MPCACPSQGSSVVYLSKAGDGTQSMTTGATRDLIERWGLRTDDELIVDTATAGNRMVHTSRARSGLKRRRGQNVLRPTFNNLKNTWAQRILGGSPDTGVFTPALTLPFFAWFAGTAAKQLQFEGCKVASAEFSAESGQSLSLSLDVISKGYQSPAITIPSIAIGTAVDDLPLVFHAATLVLNSIDYCFSRFRLRIDNGIRDLFYNSQGAKCLNEGPLSVTLSLDLPWNADTATALFGHGADGLPVNLTFVSSAGVSQVLFDMPSVKWPDRSPEIPDQNEISLPLECQCFATASPTITITCELL